MLDDTFCPDLYENYRLFPGPIENWDGLMRRAISVLLQQGLRENTMFLDVGCGPLRMGRYLIPFLLPCHYFGLEPEKKILLEAFRKELILPWGNQFIEYKQPRFAHNPDFDLSEFGDVKFDMVLACQVFIHCGREQFRQCLVSVRDRLADGGKFIVTISLSPRDEDKEVEKSPDRHWSYRYASHAGTYYRRDSFVQLILESGFYPYHLGTGRSFEGNHWVLTLDPVNPIPPRLLFG